MKRTDLIKKLTKNGWYFKCDGEKHEIWTNETCTEAIPCHRKINEMLAKSIIKKYDLK